MIIVSIKQSVMQILKKINFDYFNVCMHQGNIIHLNQQHPVVSIEFQMSQLK